MTKGNTGEENSDTGATEPGKSEQKKEYNRSDYEYKSWSGGVPAPDGWERCPGYNDVIRRLKPVSPNPEAKADKISPKAASCQKKTEDSIFTESWNKPQGGCCC